MPSSSNELLDLDFGTVGSTASSNASFNICVDSPRSRRVVLDAFEADGRLEILGLAFDDIDDSGGGIVVWFCFASSSNANSSSVNASYNSSSVRPSSPNIFELAFDASWPGFMGMVGSIVAETAFDAKGAVLRSCSIVRFPVRVGAVGFA